MFIFLCLKKDYIKCERKVDCLFLHMFLFPYFLPCASLTRGHPIDTLKCLHSGGLSFSAHPHIILLLVILPVRYQDTTTSSEKFTNEAFKTEIAHYPRHPFMLISP